MANSRNLSHVIEGYVAQIKKVLGSDFIRAYVYGSYARGEYDDKNESDLDIVIFTHRPAAEFYMLVNEIAEITYEYSVKYDVILSPVFQNQKQFEHMADVLPFYQNIQKEGIAVG